MNVATEIDPQKLAEVLTAVQSQIATALWLSTGMLLAFAAIVCGALRWRRAALGFGFCYAFTLCFVHNGHAALLGPIGCAVALAGMFWPDGRARDRGKSDDRH